MPREFFDEELFVCYYINALLQWITSDKMSFKRLCHEEIVPRDAQKQYVMDRYGVESVPRGWHPETHHSGRAGFPNDWRPLTRSWPLTSRWVHWTSDGGWILHIERFCKQCQHCGARIVMDILIEGALTCKECPEAAVAFAMGTHAKLGANSGILPLDSDLIAKIVSFI